MPWEVARHGSDPPFAGGLSTSRERAGGRRLGACVSLAASEAELTRHAEEGFAGRAEDRAVDVGWFTVTSAEVQNGRVHPVTGHSTGLVYSPAGPPPERVGYTRHGPRVGRHWWTFTWTS